MISKHSNEEIKGMIDLITKSLEELIECLDKKHEITAEMLIPKYRDHIEEIINKPYGGTLAPEEIAEIIVSQELLPKRHFTEEAAATTYI
jgi:phosphopantetheine adenylyltransferase